MSASRPSRARLDRRRSRSRRQRLQSTLERLESRTVLSAVPVGG